MFLTLLTVQFETNIMHPSMTDFRLQRLRTREWGERNNTVQKEITKRIRHPRARFVSWVWPELVMVIIHRIMLCTCKFEKRDYTTMFVVPPHRTTNSTTTLHLRAHVHIIPLYVYCIINFLFFFFFLSHTRLPIQDDGDNISDTHKRCAHTHCCREYNIYMIRRKKIAIM